MIERLTKKTCIFTFTYWMCLIETADLGNTFIALDFEIKFIFLTGTEFYTRVRFFYRVEWVLM